MNKMHLKRLLHDEMIALYEKAGKDTGYWGNRYLQSVKKNGALETARRMLGKILSDPSKKKGFQTLIDAGRIDLSVESLVLQPRFKSLFMMNELAEAQRRLDSIPAQVKRRSVPPEQNFPESLEDERSFSEGAKKAIMVNSYERDAEARKICLKKHGFRCAVCNLLFEEIYGSIGKNFIHVHHKKPLAGIRDTYHINPSKDLVQVCPNCHAMLHTSNPPLGIEELKERIANHRLQ